MKTSQPTIAPIAERLKNGYSDACTELGREALTIEHFAFLPQSQSQAFFALHKIHTFIEALNEGHEFDWNDNDEDKYFAWWDMETYGDALVGSGFALNGVHCTRTTTGVSARLCTRTRAHAELTAKVMFEEYKIWIKG